MKPASKLGLSIHISGKRISVTGDIPEHMAVGFMSFLCQWESTTRDVSWEQVRAFGAFAEVRWVGCRQWLNIPIPVEAIQGILTTSAPSVIMKLLSSTKTREQAQSVIQSLSLKDTIRLVRKIQHHPSRISVIEVINREHLPVLITEEKLGSYVLECITKRLSG
jgi:hypothetical protein